MLIGMFGFYTKWLTDFELRIASWRDILKSQPPPGTMTAAQEREMMSTLWQMEDKLLLEQLKQEVIESVVLARPHYDGRFYLKTDWSRHGMGAVLCQVDPNCEESLAAERAEVTGGPCIFDKTLFLSRLCKDTEQNYHSYVGEAATGRWAIGKLLRFLRWQEFTWITDCSGLRQFFSSDAHRD
jgi:hypothetical protein